MEGRYLAAYSNVIVKLQLVTGNHFFKKYAILLLKRYNKLTEADIKNIKCIIFIRIDDHTKRRNHDK
ncbi:hypothetical protein CWR48_19135 [Oceanobacillus arenosus]|uniref:Uncharacterized protein n=1 Tax=Oceanobacillus arenosus TaxID=1229153 RepID=A0A3D8PIB6_9BACI|nr:hypothetical protein CWR48_19135 [Oceanobacillus arenosus]